MKPNNQLVQCLQCDRLKSAEGQWYQADAGDIRGDISHTYCPDCITVLQDRLLAARHFKDWSFEQQMNFLETDLDRHEQKFDRTSFKNYLEEFFCIESKDFEKFYEALKDKLANAVCPNCNNEVIQNPENQVFGNHILHSRCYRELNHKIKIILDNNWNKSDKFSAYLDLLKIEKSIRPALKAALKKMPADETISS